jgi:FMN phosphatase YigB (HAD superfamily)
MEKKIVYVDMDNVLVDFTSGIMKIDHDTFARFDDRLDEVPGIFSLLLSNHLIHQI